MTTSLCALNGGSHLYDEYGWSGEESSRTPNATSVLMSERQ